MRRFLTIAYHQFMDFKSSHVHVYYTISFGD